MSRPSRNDDPRDQQGEPDKNGAPKAHIDALEIEPIERTIGAGRSEIQWCRTHVNNRTIHLDTRFPSPYAKLAGLDDTIVEHYSVTTGSLCRDDVHNATAHGCMEEEDLFALQFSTLEDAVAFCLSDAFAQMSVELYRRQVILMEQSEAARGKSPREITRYRVHFSP